jgi:hypothetical protein
VHSRMLVVIEPYDLDFYMHAQIKDTNYTHPISYLTFL